MSFEMRMNPESPALKRASGSGWETRRRLIDAGAELFARKGYQDTSIREIVLAAQANIAAVSYHFRGKEGLYREVIAFLVDPMSADNATLSAADDLRGALVSVAWSALMRVQHDRRALLRRIEAWELLRPSGIVMPDTVRVQLDVGAMNHALKEIFGGAWPDDMQDRRRRWFIALVDASVERWRGVKVPAVGRAKGALDEAELLVDSFLHGIARHMRDD